MLHPSSRNWSLPGLRSPSCHLAAGKTHISHCQELNILTSLYLLDLPSNSKPNSYCSIFKPLSGAGKTPPICFMPLSEPPLYSKLFGILCLQLGKLWPACSWFHFQGILTQNKEGSFFFSLAFCHSSNFESSLVWLISSSALIGDSAPTLWLALHAGDKCVPMETELSLHCWPVKWSPPLPERNQLVTWLISHQYNSGKVREGKKTEKQAVFKMCERLSMFDPSTLYLMLPCLPFTGLIVSILFAD